MLHFAAVPSHVGSQHALQRNDPYMLSFDLPLRQQRTQGMYLAELEDAADRRYLRIFTPVGPLASIDAARCLRFNWQQRTGFLAVEDLDGVPYLHLCENRPYASLGDAELDRLVLELGTLGDQLEQLISSEVDAL